MNNITDKSIELFLNELASKQATPGGGSVAAVMGAQAAALISMVCRLTIGKPQYQAVEPPMRQLLAQAETLRGQLTAMITTDIEVFNQLMTCYRLPKDNAQQTTQRSICIQSALKEAVIVPLACAKACAKTIELSRIAADKGNKAVVSDAGVAVMSGYSALKSAALNVYGNARMLKDRRFADAQVAQLEKIMNGTQQEADAIYQLVKNKQ